MAKVKAKSKKKPVKAARPTKRVKPARPAKKRAAKRAPIIKAKAAPRKPARPAGVPEQLRDAALQVLEDRKAEQIVTLDLRSRSAFADYLIIASARAAKQGAAIAHYLREAFMKHGITGIRIEGLPEANWVLVDAGDVVVHVFRPEVRRYYEIEEIYKARSPKARR